MPARCHRTSEANAGPRLLRVRGWLTPLAQALRPAVDTLRRPAAALLLYVLLAIAIVSPLMSPIMPDTPAQDLANHVAGIIEARNALTEGQFPIRISPRQCNAERYPTFQFYGNFPYTVGGLLYRYGGIPPYWVYKILLMASLAGAGFYVFRCTCHLTGAVNPSVLAGAVFVTAPYLMTDIHARSAFTETVAFNLLPVVLFYALRAFARRPAGVLLGGVAWSFLALSHNIAFFYGSLFVCLYFLLHALWRREQFVGLLCVGAGYALGLVLTAWYVAPQFRTLPLLAVGNENWPDYLMSMNWLTPLGVLLAPTLVLPRPYPALDNARFGLQVGWPILAGVWLAARYLWSAGLPVPWRGGILRLLLLFAVAFFLVWTPVDVWHHLPRIFSFTQFTYRLLMFCVLFGSLLVGYAVAHCFRRGLRTEHMALAVLGLGMFVSPYLTPLYTTTYKVSEEQEIRHPDIGRGGNNRNYVLTPAALARAPLAPPGASAGIVPRSSTRAATRYGHPTWAHLHLEQAALVQLPVLFYPGLLDVRLDGRAVRYGNIDKYLALPVPAGTHAVRVRFIGLRWANRLSLAGWVIVLAGLPVCAGLALGRRLRRRPLWGIVSPPVSP